MASSKPSSGLLDRVSCQVCMNKYDYDVHVPKLLPCEHTFCLVCLKSLSTSVYKADDIECPLCRAKHSVPPRGFITNRTALDVIDELENDITSPSPSKLTCNEHKGAECVLVCTDCISGLCPKCIKQSTHQGHHLEELSDAKTVLKPIFDTQIRMEQASLCRRKNKVTYSVDELYQAVSDIYTMCDEAITLITSWKKDQLLKIENLEQLAAALEDEVETEIVLLQSLLEQSDIGTMLTKLKSDQTQEKRSLDTAYTKEMNKYDFRKQTASLRERLQVLFSQKNVTSTVLDKPKITGQVVSKVSSTVVSSTPTASSQTTKQRNDNGKFAIKKIVCHGLCLIGHFSNNDIVFFSIYDGDCKCIHKDRLTVWQASELNNGHDVQFDFVYKDCIGQMKDFYLSH